MENNDHRSIWRFFDGSVSISVSMLLAVLVDSCGLCARLPLLSLLASLTERENGIIIVATLLLFPTAAALYGGFTVFFAAKEAVERRAKEKGREEGRQEGRQEGLQAGIKEGRQAERERVNKVLAEAGVVLTPELVKKLAGEDG